SGSEGQVMVRRCDVNSSDFDRLIVPGVVRGERPGPVEYNRKIARAVGRDMDDDDDRCRQARRQTANQTPEGRDPTRGRPNHDDVMTEHDRLLTAGTSRELAAIPQFK